MDKLPLLKPIYIVNFTNIEENGFVCFTVSYGIAFYKKIKKLERITEGKQRWRGPYLDG